MPPQFALSDYPALGLRNGKQFRAFALDAPPVRPSRQLTLRLEPPLQSLTDVPHEPGEVIVDSYSLPGSLSSKEYPDNIDFCFGPLSPPGSPEITATGLDYGVPPPLPKPTASSRTTRANGRRRRRRLAEAEFASEAHVKKVLVRRKDNAAFYAISASVATIGLPHSKPAWIGARNAALVDPPSEADADAPTHSLSSHGMVAKTLTDEELKRFGRGKALREVPWDGKTSIPLVDSENRTYGVLGGQPRDARWSGLASSAVKKADACHDHLNVSADERQHRRAQVPFAAVPCGVSHGGGQKEPGVLRLSVRNEKAMRALLSHEFFVRVVGFTNVLMALWAPTLFGYYLMTRAALWNWKPALKAGWPFPRSVFAACTINFKSAVSRTHVDFANLAWGWCAITALGDFDPDRGGHLILWEMGLIIRFPPGSTILIPSAAIHHSNAPIRPGESRTAFIQYTAGGLFRWRDNGFRSNDDFERFATEAEKETRGARAETRWEDGVAMWDIVV